MEQAAKFAETTQILMNVSEFTDVSQATDTLISAVQAFGYTAETSMDVVDLLNTIGNNYAISTADLAKSLTKSSASLVAAGGDLAEAAALTATANKIIQDADAVGTALKTTSLRLRGTDVKVLEEEGLDSEGAVTSKSKLQSKVKALSGVDILTATGEYKSTYEILSQIADVWESMNDMDQAALLELISGKRNSSVIAAILQNPEELKAAFQDANNASGSALRENEKYLDSIQGKIDQFNNAVQTMWANTLDSKLVKDIVEFGTWIIKTVDKIGLLNTALAGLATYSMLKHKTGPIAFFKGIIEAGTQGIAKATDYVKGLKEVTFETSKLANAKATLTQTQLKEKLTNTGLTDSVAEEIVAKTNLGKATDELSASTLDATLREAGYSKEKRESILQSVFDTQVTDENTQANKENANSNVEAGSAEDKNTQDKKENISTTKQDTQATKENTQANKENAQSTVTLGQKMKNLGKGIGGFIKQNASTLIMLATTLLVTGLNHVVDATTKTMDELQDEFDDAVSELNSTNTELDNLTSQLKDVNKQIEEINKNTPLSFTDNEELSRLQAQSTELQRQIDLTNTLKEQQEYDVNNKALAAAQAQRDIGVKSGKTTDERVGNTVKTVGGAGIAITGAAAMSAAATMGTVGAANAWNPVGWVALAAAAVTLIAGVVAHGIAESEEKVGDSLDNMKEQYSKLQNDFNTARAEYNADPTNKKKKKKFEEAQEALKTYQANMASYMMEQDSYYQQIRANWDTATTEQKQAAIDWADQMDTWAIQTGGANAKTNAIARIFGDEASDELKEIKTRIQEAAEAGEEVNLADAFNGDEEAYNAFKQRLYNIGLTVYEVEQYFTAEKEAAEEAMDAIETYDAIKNIEKLTSGVNELKNAFKELHEEGIASAETLLGLESVFKDTEGWQEFFEVMSSGTATMEEVEEKSRTLAENYVDQVLGSGELTGQSYLTVLNHLQKLGVTNASEFLNAKIKKDAINKIANNYALTAEEKAELDKLARIENHGKLSEDGAKRLEELRNRRDAEPDRVIKQLEEEYGIVLDGENDKLLIEKAITVEKKKQEALDKKGAHNDYLKYLDAINQNEEIDTEIEKVNALSSFNEIENGGYGVTRSTTVSMGYTIPVWHYQGKDYYTVDDLKAAIVSNFESTKVDVPEKPTNIVTELDVTNANNAVTDAVNTYQEELDKYGLTLDIDLIGFDEKVDKVQDVYSTLKNIATEYNTQGYLSLDNLQALLQLTPEYLAVLQMENGQITINQAALQSMLETKLAEAEATAVQTAITQLSALAERKQAIEISNSAVAANQASIELGTYSSMLGTVAQDAIIAAGSVTAFNNALKGAQDNTFVSDDEINQILSNFNNSVELINSVRGNLPSSFNDILDPGSKTSPEDVADDRFQKAMGYWENRIAANQAKSEQVQNEIDLIESKGQKADASFYEKIIELENERKWLLEQQKAEAQSYLATLEEGSEEWWEVANTLNDIEGELDDVTTSIVDLQDAIGEIDAYKFEEFNNRLDNLASKLETIRNLIAPEGEEDWFDDEGNWTEDGVAVLGSYLQELETYKQGYQNTMDELAKYEPDYEGNEAYYEALGIHSEQEYYDRVEELTDQQYQFAESISDTEQEIVGMYESSIDAVEEHIDTLIDGYNDYIDSVKEALDAERDLYDFKKNVQKQAKDIAAIERRIMSLSGSTNAADIAERRRLEADLYGAREELDDTYYNHAKESQQNALDAEAEAYEEQMTKFVEGLRTSLEEATANMDEFLMGVTSMVMYNADTILTKYEETNLPLTKELTDPWEEAKKAVGTYSGDALALMNQWTKEGGFFDQFNATGTTNLQSPWSAGATAANSFKTSVSTVMSDVVSNIAKNVKTASGALSNLYQQIITTEQRASNANVNASNSGSNPDNYVATQKKYYVTASLDMGSSSLSVTTSDSDASQAMSAAKIAILGEYEKVKGNSISAESAWQKTWRNKVQYTTQYYAKGTTGTSRDEWALTDELGDELVLVPGKDGNLSFMRKGTGVVPADMTQKLFELAQIPACDLMNKNLTAILPNITKNDFKNEFNFESLVHVDTVDSDTLPKLEKMVDKKIDDFSKALNYSLKRFAR